MLSTDAGAQRHLLRLTTDAAVYCVIMKPLLTPGLATRKLGSPLVPDNHTLTYKMDMVLDGASDAVISKEYKLTAYAPDVVVSNFRIVDSSSSQPNGVIDNGETVTGVVTFVNNGRAAATDVSMRVSSADAPYLSFPAEPVPVGTLEPGASATVRFEYSASDGDVMYKLYTLDIAALSQEREMVYGLPWT